MPEEVLAEGGNYRISLQGSRLTATVRRRRDLDTASGADDAERMTNTIIEHALRGRSLLFDLREAPISFGPRTEAALAGMLRVFEAAGLRVAILANDGLQLLQARRLIGTTSPRHGRAFDALTAAEAHLA